MKYQIFHPSKLPINLNPTEVYGAALDIASSDLDIRDLLDFTPLDEVSAEYGYILTLLQYIKSVYGPLSWDIKLIDCEMTTNIHGTYYLGLTIEYEDY